MQLKQSSPTDSQRTDEVAGLIGVALTSFSALLLELGLTRIFSVVLFYHFAFLVISIALLGLGAGGLFAYMVRRRIRTVPIAAFAGAVSTLNAVVVVLLVYVVLHTQVALALGWGGFLRLTVLYIASAVPFFFTGIVMSVLFAGYPRRIAQLYGADLLGGAAACLALIPALDHIGAPNTILCSAIALACAGIAWAKRSIRRLSVVFAVIISILLVANLHGGILDVIYAKGFRRPVPLFAKWNALSRVEVDQVLRGKVIVIDADASTPIVSTDPYHWDSGYERALMSAPPSVVNVLRPTGSYAIIGPGGGPDILRAIANGSRNIAGIEINPIIATDIMRDEYAIFAHHIYDLPEVHIHVADGRSFIRNSHEKYDVVQMTLVDTWASTAAGAFALSENNLYTVEAFKEYFAHLKADGMIAITRWEFARPREALRVVSQSIQALHELGVSDCSRHLLVVSDGALDSDGRQVLVLAKKSAFTEEEQAAALKHLSGTDRSNVGTNLKALYLPFENSSLPAKPEFSELIHHGDPWRFSSSYDYKVSPVRDNAPFFFFTVKANRIFSGERNAIDWKVNLGVAVLGVVLLISILAVVFLLLLPLLMSRELRSAGNLSIIYFLAIGLGYIFVEIVMIQRFVLFLGHPTYALTVVIFFMLLSSGAGSFMSGKLLANPLKIGRWLAAICGLIVVYTLILSPVLEGLVGLRFGTKLIISAALLLPLGLLMGLPFPSGLRALNLLKESGAKSIGTIRHDGMVEWAWTINAGASVLGSVFAMVVALQLGLTTTLFCAAMAYMVALLSLPLFRTLQAEAPRVESSKSPAEA